MNTTTMTISVLTLLALTGCSKDEGDTTDERSAIQLQLKGDATAVRSRIDTLDVVLNHEVEYNRETTKINTDWMDLTDYDGDGEIELVLSIDPSRGGDELPTIELRPGDNTSAFTVMVHGNSSSGEWVYTEEEVGPLEFTDAVQFVDVDLTVREEAAHGCNNGLDDDELGGGRDYYSINSGGRSAASSYTTQPSDHMSLLPS